MRTLVFSCIVVAVIFAVPHLISGQQPDTGNQEDAPFYGLITLRGVEPPVRGEGEAKVGTNTKRVPMEAFFDADFGTLLYVTSDGSVAASQFPTQFQLRTALVGESLEAVKVSVSTGQSWRMVDEEWVAVEEAAANELNLGDYDVKIITEPAEQLVVLLRFDRRSGNTWYINDLGKWELVANPVVDE